MPSCNAGGDPLNVRSGPSHDYAMIGSLPDGEVLEILGRMAADDWFLVRLAGNGEGWVDGQWVTPEVPLESIPIIEIPATPTPAVDPHFRADSTSISAGSCTTLHWDAEGISAAYLDGNGVAGHGAQQVCPAGAQTFVVLWNEGNTLLYLGFAYPEAWAGSRAG